MHLYLIRHGETDWNCEGRCQGVSDMPLNATGLRQAEALAARLAPLQIEAVYASPLQRAVATATIIAKGKGIDVETVPDLQELDQGVFEGLCFAEIKGTHGEFLKQWFVKPATLAIPGGESLQQVQDRAAAALDTIVERHPTGNVVVVAHNMVNHVLLCRLMKVHLDDFRRIGQDVATLNIIEFGGRFPHPVVQRLNDTSHLEATNR